MVHSPEEEEQQMTTFGLVLLGLSCLCFGAVTIMEITDIHRRLFVLETKKQEKKK